MTTIEVDGIYGYDTPDGRRISVSVTVTGKGPPSVHLNCGPGYEGCMVSAAIPGAKVPEVARGILTALHEGAGLPVPIVLDRVPESHFREWFTIDRGAFPGVLFDVKGPLTFAATREMFAAVLGAVERAENEPEPAEVEALAEVLHEARERCGGAGELDRQSARTILTRYTLTERKPGGVSDA